MMYTTILILSLLSAFSGAPGPVTPEQIRAEAETLIAAKYQSGTTRFVVRVVRTGGDLETDRQIQLALRKQTEVPRGHTQVDVLARSNTRGWQKVGWALLYVAHFDSVLVTTESLSDGDPVTSDHVSAVWMETTKFRGTPLRPRDFRSLRARHPLYARRGLTAGRALRRDDLRPPYAADTGEAVLMLYRRGDLLLKLSCKAREPGYAGDLIRLYFPDTQTTYRARLTGPGTAEWVETL